MTWEMKGKAPYLLPRLSLIPCFPSPNDILSICLCCTQISLPSHLERQCSSDCIPFKFILRNIATWFSNGLLKHLYPTWDDLHVPAACPKKPKGRTRNLLQPSPELDMFVDMLGKRKPESTVGLKDLQIGGEI